MPEALRSPSPLSHRHGVLVVDDDAGCREALVAYLQYAGFVVDSALSGQAALAHLRAGARPCVVLTDVLMQDIDGWELVDALRTDPQLADLPVVMMSGFPEHAARALRLGVRAYLPKPTHPEEIGKAIARYCHQQAD